jgi:hypothetical protein
MMVVAEAESGWKTDEASDVTLNLSPWLNNRQNSLQNRYLRAMLVGGVNYGGQTIGSRLNQRLSIVPRRSKAVSNDELEWNVQRRATDNCSTWSLT